MEPMASEAASMRLRCFVRALIPAARIGNTGTSQRFWTIQVIESQRMVGRKVPKLR